MIKAYTVSRDDAVYECFPDLVRLPSGRMICVFRESRAHADLSVNRLVYVISEDDGRTWSEKHVLTPAAGAEAAYNCPRISLLPDGTLAILCDVSDRRAGELQGGLNEQHLFLSRDGGDSWEGPRILPLQGIVPDKYRVLQSGRHIIGLHHTDPNTGKLAQYAYLSDDGGDTWRKVTVASDPDYNLCEVSFVEEEGGILVAFLRENSWRGVPCLKAFSYDNGETWEGVYPTHLDSAHRPVAGRCASGEYLITYRYMPGGRFLGSWTQNLFGALLEPSSLLAKEREGHGARIFPIAYDRNRHSDTGYSGWVETAPGEFYVVTYLLDDAPRAQIRGYAFSLQDIVL